MGSADTERAVATMMWRRLDTAGHDVCALVRRTAGWALDGAAVFAAGRAACAVAYRIECDAAFRTQRARVRGWLGRKPLLLDVRASPRGRWRVNGAPAPEVDGCVDFDLNMSPSTNLLSLRRVRPRVGETVSVRAAWLVFPKMKLKPLEQTYHRTNTSTYAYDAPTVKFSTRLKAEQNGFITEYPPLWTRALSGK